MFVQLIQRYWVRTFLLALIVGAVGMTTFFTAQHHSAKAASTDPSFTVTDGDTYQFTDNTPTSSSGSQVDLGNWTVTDTTTNTNLGTLSGTFSASQTGTYSFTDPTTGQVTATYPMITETSSIQAPSPLGTLNGTSTSFPNAPDYTTSSAYKSDVANGDSLADITQETIMGDSRATMDCPSTGGKTCDEIGISASGSSAVDLGDPSSPASGAIDDGITDEQLGYGTLQGVSASTIPSQLLARQFGGGPLAMHRPMIAPLAIFAIGLAINIAGVVVSNICNYRNASNPCSGKVKGALAIVGGLMTLIGGAVAGFSGAVFSGAATATASAGQVAAGFELTQAAIGESTALLSSQLETIQSALAPLANASITIAGA